jgi:HPt (histidine-containing phosphotransfer) domain-containing protein
MREIFKSLGKDPEQVEGTQKPRLTEEEAELLDSLGRKYNYDPRKIRSSDLPEDIIGRASNLIELDDRRNDQTLSHEIVHQLHRAVGTERAGEISDSLASEYGEEPLPSEFEYPERWSDRPHEQLAMALEDALMQQVGVRETGSDTTSRDQMEREMARLMLEESQGEELDENSMRYMLLQQALKRRVQDNGQSN